MPRLTPEERAAWEAVRDDARRRWPQPSNPALEEQAYKLYRAADALLSADAGREANASDVAVGRDAMAMDVRIALGPYDHRGLPVVECVRQLVALAGSPEPPFVVSIETTATGAHFPAAAAMAEVAQMQEAHEAKMAQLYPPAPARDEELADLLDAYRDALMNRVVGRADGGVTLRGNAYAERSAIEAHVSRREAEARGVTVATGELVGDTVIWNDPYPSIEIQCHESGGARYLRHGDRVRLVRDAKEGEQ